ncbi:MAG: DUF2783 domain-containing protein [Cohaesibacter sp.]|nr:DUF2783 domain-containing protein [Cohaesibacter sp.]
MALKETLAIADPDGFYQELIESQRDMSEDEQQLMNAKLVLILANEVGDRAKISAAIKLAARRP